MPIFHSKDFNKAEPPDFVMDSKVGEINEVVTTMISASFNPMIVMKRPIPTVIARFKEFGTAITSICLIFVIVKIIKIIPEINTAPRATLQGMPTPVRATVAKRAFNPIPGAKAIGKLATNPMAMVTIPAEIAVAKNTAFLSIPVEERIFGFRNRMYAMVIKVVTPAIISVFAEVLYSVNLNNFSSIVWLSFNF